MGFVYGFHAAVAVQINYALPSAVDPNTHTVDFILPEALEFAFPEIDIHMSVEVVPVLPWGVHAAEPELAAVYYKLCAIDGNSRRGFLGGSAGAEQYNHCNKSRSNF